MSGKTDMAINKETEVQDFFNLQSQFVLPIEESLNIDNVLNDLFDDKLFDEVLLQKESEPLKLHTPNEAMDLKTTTMPLPSEKNTSEDEFMEANKLVKVSKSSLSTSVSKKNGVMNRKRSCASRKRKLDIKETDKADGGKPSLLKNLLMEESVSKEKFVKKSEIQTSAACSPPGSSSEDSEIFTQSTEKEFVSNFYNFYRGLQQEKLKSDSELEANEKLINELSVNLQKAQEKRKELLKVRDKQNNKLNHIHEMMSARL